MSLAPRLALLRLVSPALPVGGFAWSRGLEGAVHDGCVHDETSLQEWILGVLEHVLCPLEGALLRRLHAAWSAGDLARVRELALELRAFRESAEFALEDEQMGLALARVLAGLGVQEASAEQLRDVRGYAVMFALAAVRWGIAPDEMLGGFFFAFAETQVSAALRLLSLGQSAGQRVLHAALPVVEHCVPLALALEDDDIGSFAPGLARASARHEVQYSRLFRS